MSFSMDAEQARRLSQLVDEAKAKNPRALTGLAFGDSNVVYCAADIFVIAIGVGGVGRSEALAKSMIDHHAKVNDVSVSPDGNCIVSACADNALHVWSVTPDHEYKQLGLMSGHTDKVVCCRCSPDGLEVASGGADRAVMLWHLESRKLDRKLEGHTGTVNCVAYSRDGDRLVSGSDDRTVRVWNLAALSFQKQCTVFEGHAGAVLACAMSANGEFVASAGEDKTVRVWDLATEGLFKRTVFMLKQEIRPKCRVLKNHSAPVTSVAFLPSGALASCGRDGAVNIWDLNTERPVWRVSSPEAPLVCIAVSPDGKTLVGGREDTSMVYWNLEDANLEEKIQERVLQTPRGSRAGGAGARSSVRSRLT